MRPKKWIQGVTCLFVLLAIAWPLYGGVPTEKIRETTDEILAIVTNPELKNDPTGEKERKRRIREAVDKRFDWDEMGRRALARHWAQRTEEERKEFIDLFGKLLERTYLDKVEGYSGEKVVYGDERVDGDYGVVQVKILTKKNEQIDVEYRMITKDRDWRVYDISIAGVSLVNNYRVQFNSILSRSSFKTLLVKLKEKIENP